MWGRLINYNYMCTGEGGDNDNNDPPVGGNVAGMIRLLNLSEHTFARDAAPVLNDANPDGNVYIEGYVLSWLCNSVFGGSHTNIDGYTSQQLVIEHDCSYWTWITKGMRYL